jgi:hypothetical protein
LRLPCCTNQTAPTVEAGAPRWHPFSVRIRRLLPKGERVVRIPVGLARGSRLNVDLRHASLRVLLGLYEIELNKHVRQLCPPGTVSMDIGGQIGLEALAFSRLSQAPVLCVDSDPAAYESICKNVAINGRRGQRIVVRLATIGDGSNGTTTLDDLKNEFGVPGFVKIDIEGAESLALEGAPILLSKHHPNLVIETHGREIERECVRILREQDYRVRFVEPRQWLADQRPIEHNRWIVATASPARRTNDLS